MIFDETGLRSSTRRLRLIEFYAHESLRQVHAVPRGQLLDGADPASGSCAGQGTAEDLDTLLDTCDNILGRVVLRPR